MTQRSPTSNGCMTNMKMIASTRVLHTLPNRNAMSSICENTNTSRCIGEIPNMSNQTISTVSAKTTSTVLCSFFTAVSMSLNDNAKARLSLYTATCRDHSHPKGCNQNQVFYLLSFLHVGQNGNVVERNKCVGCLGELGVFSTQGGSREQLMIVVTRISKALKRSKGQPEKGKSYHPILESLFGDFPTLHGTIKKNECSNGFLSVHESHQILLIHKPAQLILSSIN